MHVTFTKQVKIDQYAVSNFKKLKLTLIAQSNIDALHKEGYMRHIVFGNLQNFLLFAN